MKYAAMDRYEAEDVIRAAPAHNADTVALLRRDSLCFEPTRCVRSYDRMIEFGYEIPGWAIVGFNADSTWAQVTLSPHDSTGPRGWVALVGDSVQAVAWPALLLDNPLFFLRPQDIAFYSAPRATAQVARQLVKVPSSERPNYIMTPLARHGEWLMVDLQTPSLMCEPADRPPPPDTVWIRFLTPQGRPRVFYYTRGC